MSSDTSLLREFDRATKNAAAPFSATTLPHSCPPQWVAEKILGMLIMEQGIVAVMLPDALNLHRVSPSSIFDPCSSIVAFIFEFFYLNAALKTGIAA